MVKHVTRPFIIATDRLKVFDDEVTLEEAMKYMPDQTDQTGILRELTFGKVRREMGCDPIFLSCHLCFAQSFSEAKLNAFLALNYSELYVAVGKWERLKASEKDVEDTFPPNFHMLIKTAIAGPSEGKRLTAQISETSEPSELSAKVSGEE